jgi:hypothetical protein
MAEKSAGRFDFVRGLLDKDGLIKKATKQRDGLMKKAAGYVPTEGRIGRTLRKYSPIPIPSPRVNKAGLMDKLLERLRFEKAGVDLYDLVIARVDGELPPDMMSTLRDHRSEEAAHMEMLARHVLDLGGDPGAITPSVKVVEENASRLEAVVKSDNAKPIHRLQCLLDAELEDSVSWELLVALAREAGGADMVKDFLQAERRELEHVRDTRKLIARLTGHEVLGHPLEPMPLRM